MPGTAPVRRDEEAVRRFVEHTAMVLSDLGLPRMHGRVLLALMTADEDALTAADLAERLDVSPAAISGAVRYLMQIGFLTREPVRGSRRVRYRLHADAWYEASLAKSAFIRTLADLSEEGVAAVGGRATPSGKRVAHMRDFLRFVQGEMDGLLEKWRATEANEEVTERAG